MPAPAAAGESIATVIMFFLFFNLFWLLISVRFLTNEIRSDAIKIIIHKKKCETFNNCKITNIDSETNSQIKFAILKIAAELEKKDLEKTKEKNSDVKLPKNF